MNGVGYGTTGEQLCVRGIDDGLHVRLVGNITCNAVDHHARMSSECFAVWVRKHWCIARVQAT